MPAQRPVQAHQRVAERDDCGCVRRDGSHRKPTRGSRRGLPILNPGSAHHAPVSTTGLRGRSLGRKITGTTPNTRHPLIRHGRPTRVGAGHSPAHPKTRSERSHTPRNRGAPEYRAVRAPNFSSLALLTLATFVFPPPHLDPSR